MSNSTEQSFLSRIDLSSGRSYGSRKNAQRPKESDGDNISTSNSGIDTSTNSFRNMPVLSHRNLKMRRWAAGIVILIILTLERIAFYSLAGNVLLFLNQKPFLWLSYNAMTATYVLTGIAFVSSIFGGWLADSVLGRYCTILIGLFFYILCYIVLTLLAMTNNPIPDMCLDPNKATKSYRLDWATSAANESLNSYNSQSLMLVGNTEKCGWLIYLLLAGIGISVGLVKTNLGPFGAEQVKDLGVDAIRIFFNWYYWCINIGGLVAIAGIAYIQQSTFYGFGVGYLIPTCLLAFGMIAFSVTKPLFKVQKPHGSIITTILYIIKDSIRYRFSRNSYYEHFQNEEIPLHERPTCLDMAKVRFGGKYPESSVDDVKMLGNIISVFLALVPYWILYFQMQTTFLVQGLHMKLGPKSDQDESELPESIQSAAFYNVNEDKVKKFSIPAAWLSLFDIGFVLLFIPLMDRVVYPFLSRLNIGIPPIARMVIGMTFASIAMVFAGSVESYRLHVVNVNNDTITQVIGNTSYFAADMWIFWQIPQYSFIGLSEVFASVAGLEFAYQLAPPCMVSIVMGLFYFFTGIGSFLGTGLLNAFRNVWFSDRDNGNINFGHLDYYFFLLAGIQFFFLIVFVVAVQIYHKRCSAQMVPPPSNTDEDSD